MQHKWLLFSFFFLFARSNYAAIPHSVEGLYIQAVVNFQDQKYSDCLKDLNQALEIEPNQKDLLELKALSLKSNKNWKEAEETYKQLISSQKKESSVSLPYYFEIGSLRVQQEKFSDAKRIFQICIEKKFNVEASKLYLGEIALKEKQYREAQNIYLPLTTSGPLKPSAYLYLSLLFGELKSGQAQHESLYAANQALAATEPTEKLLGNQSYQAIKKTLDSLESNYYASVGFSSGYDSNVLLYPNLSSSEGATSLSTVKSTILANIGYATKPNNPWSLLTSYVGNFNYNFNADTKSGQFFNNVVSATLYSDQLDRKHWGTRLDTNYMFQMDSSLAGYAWISTLAPFYEVLLSPITRNILSLEFLYQKYFQDDQSDSNYQKSGISLYLREKWQQNRSLGLWNPGFQLSVGYDYTAGNEFRQKSVSVDFSNFFYLSEKHRLSSIVTTGYSLFSERSGDPRSDILGKLALTYYWDLNRKLTLNLSGEARYNYSSVGDSYKYSRLSILGGLLYQI